MQEEIQPYSNEQLNALFKTKIDKIDFKKCPRLRKITTLQQFDNASPIVLKALWAQFGFDVDKKHDKMAYVGDFSMSKKADEEFEKYYKVFFKSKYFKRVQWDYVLNCKPSIAD